MSYMHSLHYVRVTYIKFTASSYSNTERAIIWPKVKIFFYFQVAESTKTIGQMILSLVMESTVIKKNNESPNQYARDRVIQSDGQGFHRDGHNINNVDQESYFHPIFILFNRIKRKLNFSPGQRVLDIPCPNSLTTHQPRTVGNSN